MIIDVHGHLCASPKLYAWFTLLLASRATYGTPPPPFSDEEMLQFAGDQAQPRCAWTSPAPTCS